MADLRSLLNALFLLLLLRFQCQVGTIIISKKKYVSSDLSLALIDVFTLSNVKKVALFKVDCVK